MYQATIPHLLNSILPYTYCNQIWQPLRYPFERRSGIGQATVLHIGLVGWYTYPGLRMQLVSSHVQLSTPRSGRSVLFRLLLQPPPPPKNIVFYQNLSHITIIFVPFVPLY